MYTYFIIQDKKNFNYYKLIFVHSSEENAHLIVISNQDDEAMCIKEEEFYELIDKFFKEKF